MIQSKLVQLTFLFIFLVITIYLTLTYENIIAFIIVYGFTLILAGLCLIALILFIGVRYQLNWLYYPVYILSLGALIYCFVYSLKKPLEEMRDKRRWARYEYEHSGGRGIFRTALETKAAVAIFNSDTVVLKRCIRKGLDVNAVGEEGTFLMYATDLEQVSLPIIKILLDHGADPNAADVSGKTLAKLRNWKGNKDVLKLLLSRGMHVPTRWFLSEDETLDAFLESGVSINQTIKVSYNTGTYNGKRVVWPIDFELIPNNIVKDKVHQSGTWTPLMVLAANSWFMNASKFISRGADVSWKDENGVDLLQILESRKALNHLHAVQVPVSVDKIDALIKMIK